MINRKQLDEIKAKISERSEKATDLDIIVSEIMDLPPGQLKKVLTATVMEVLAKYGYTQ
jgi:hypothetical protein